MGDRLVKWKAGKLSYQLRRLKVDQFEYVSMKLICLLTSGRKERVVLSSKEGSSPIISWQTSPDN